MARGIIITVLLNAAVLGIFLIGVMLALNARHSPAKIVAIELAKQRCLYADDEKIWRPCKIEPQPASRTPIT